MPFTLKPLPFPKDSLGPTMSDRTLEFHHGKHHATYVKTLNDLIAGTKYENSDLETIIRETAKSEGKEKKIFNNAAQVWNHDFFWESVAPNGGRAPPEPIAKLIDDSFGSYDNFRDKFVEAAADQFGSGWAWLVLKNRKLEIVTTHDADTPVASGSWAVWTCDVWEHAYYLDYQNERPRFVTSVIETILNWQFVSKRLTEAEALKR
jgi:superoxide dismutase, Fe-Mn family